MRWVRVASVVLGILQVATGQEEEPGIEGARFFMVRDSVYIYYSLVVQEDEGAMVSLELRRGDDTTFSYMPATVSGAVGLVRGPGQKVIIWDFKKDLPPDFSFGDNYWFKLRGRSVVLGSSLKWWHYALGGAGIAAVLYAVTAGGDDQPVAQLQTLPGPPGIQPDP